MSSKDNKNLAKNTLPSTDKSAEGHSKLDKILEEAADESSLAFSSGGSEFAAKAARLAKKHSLKVEQTYEISDLYEPCMGTVIFMIEGRRRADGENGIFEGRTIRVIDQEIHGDCPLSLAKRVKPGDMLLLPVGNLSEATDTVDYGRFKDIGEAAEGSVWMIQAPPYIQVPGGVGYFQKKKSKGGREFYPYHFARFGT